ncbi:DUF2244 domain-containing protein [Paracoccus tegillarcae]|uniref:DUF2244 domain-containing protein n=2 Tax=Paracoccus tegillarcae TaxID=1529068 RepID=A0A2K9F416_9RHOB|nr:DUF2244 domain-containing protein [Paracoccus tegillarcae]AUH35132.1 DUF2244 domain-containing protein [Paracoccus tegillarcae]
MPYDWRDIGEGEARLVLWPFRSLPRKGFVWFIAVTVTLLAMPLLAVLGSVILWGLLPFMALTVWGMWYALQRSYRSGETREVLMLSPTRLSLIRSDPGRSERHWETNPYWVRPILRAGPVEDYLTLTDGAREIELGAFLTPEERRTLHDQLLRRLADLR